MIEKMTKYSFVLLSADKEEFLSRLQDLGLVDITRSEKPVDDNTAAMLGGIEAQLRLISEIEAGSDSTLAGMKENLKNLQKSADAVRVWGDWDRKALAETGLALHFYSVPAKKFESGWEQGYAIQTVEDDGKTCWFVIVGDNAGFPLKELPEPSQELGALEDEIRKQEEDIAAYAASLETRKSEIPSLQKDLAEKQAGLSRALASAAGESAAENLLSVFEGFAPAGCDAALEKDFDAMNLVWFKDAAVLEDNPPIEFKNNKFVKMFEVLTDMYGRPAYNGFDPTPYIAVFFMLFFAFCMGDAGYGLILIALGLGLK
jgi:V/A-type H+-transporting ATPase subunit I